MEFFYNNLTFNNQIITRFEPSAFQKHKLAQTKGNEVDFLIVLSISKKLEPLH